MRTAKEKIELFMSDEVADLENCPRCSARLEREYQTYIVGIDEEGELDALMMGNKDGLFCPNCPTVVLDPQFMGEMMADHAKSEDVEYTLMGIANLDAIPEVKRDIPLGDDDNPIPVIEFQRVSNVPRRQIEHTVGRNDPCPCGSGKKYKKCCMRKG